MRIATVLRRAGGIFLLGIFGSTLVAAQSRREVREGLVEILVEDDFEARTSREVPVLVGENGERTPLILPEGQDVAPGDWVRVEGWTSDRDLVVEQTRRFERDASATAAAATSWSTGAKRALAILVNFTDDHAQPYTVAQARTTLFGATASVAAFYAETSFGGTTLTGDVAGWYTLAMNKPTTCDVYSFVAKAQAAAAAGGYAVGGYQFVIYVFPKIAACGWAGLGSVGGSGAWINQALSPYVAGHELGHNYGLSHAHSLDCGATAFGATCQRSEYGDPFDIMGGNLRHFNAASKAAMGWLPASGVATVSAGTASFALSPIESGSGLRAVKLLTPTGRTYWLEFRQGTGFDAGLSASATGGAMVRIAPSVVGGTDLLDQTPDGDPSSATFGDGALPVGGVFTDPAANVTVSALARTGSTLTVQVAYGAFAPPSVATLTPAAGPAAGGTLVTVKGTGFLPGAQLSVGGSAASVASLTPTTLSAWTTSGSVGSADVLLSNPDAQSAGLPGAFFYDFSDVPPSHLFHAPVVKVFENGISSGCGGGRYCPATSVTRDQMAVFLLRGMHGGAYKPPAAKGTVFADVPRTAPFAAWIERLYAEGITSGCATAPLRYCPGKVATRGEMAVLLLKAVRGTAYRPPAATGLFTDVPKTDGFAAWIEELSREEITSGCAENKFCPARTSSRGEMAAFLSRAFSLP